jgi:hypothetical protein
LFTNGEAFVGNGLKKSLGVLDNDTPKEVKKIMQSKAVKVIEGSGERIDVVMDLYF